MEKKPFDVDRNIYKSVCEQVGQTFLERTYQHRAFEFLNVAGAEIVKRAVVNLACFECSLYRLSALIPLCSVC